MREDAARGSSRAYYSIRFQFFAFYVDLRRCCDANPATYMLSNPTSHFLIIAFKMCGFEISTVRYKSCKLLDYGGLGWTVQPHTITSTYIHQCEDPKPKHGSASIYCDERLHTERVKVTDSGDRGHTMVTGECPACKAADEKCREVFTVNYMYYTTICASD
jgi:hypothetical protein